MTNRTWIYEYAGGERGKIDCSETITDQEILEQEWEFWSARMKKKYGPNSDLINHENCIQDWVVRNYAWECKDE